MKNRNIYKESKDEKRVFGLNEKKTFLLIWASKWHQVWILIIDLSSQLMGKLFMNFILRFDWVDWNQYLHWTRIDFEFKLPKIMGITLLDQFRQVIHDFE